ncbi:MAG: putative 3-methyladenine glycosylase [Clostridiales bacterium]|nr:putative 3-methyladenine glycosylase [Clostridiales bacterium]
MKKLPREFYEGDTLDMSKRLLGKYLVHKDNGTELMGRIVEVEAYKGPQDKAAHSYNNKRTERVEIMYGPPGFAYIFAIYGMYYCMNIVSAETGTPNAILIRALEPISDLNQLSINRYNKPYSDLNKRAIINMTNGPGKLCKAMRINKSNYGEDLCGDKLYLVESRDNEEIEICESPRINIDYAEEAIHYPWRFFIKDNPFISYPNKWKC